MSTDNEDDLTEHHRMRTIEDLRKELLEIESLRKELAEAKNLATYDYMNGQAELSAVRKELAEAKAELEVYDRTFPKKSELELHAALEAANARIAELEQLIYSAQNELGRLSDSRALLSASLDEECARAERAEARIAELENQLSEGRTQFMHEIAKYQSEHCFRLLYQSERDEAIAHAERAEAQADSLRATIDNMRAMNIKLTMDATSQVLAAEAKCKGLQEALEYYAAYERFGFRCETARAALNPSPAEREG